MDHASSSMIDDSTVSGLYEGGLCAAGPDEPGEHPALAAARPLLQSVEQCIGVPLGQLTAPALLVGDDDGPRGSREADLHTFFERYALRTVLQPGEVLVAPDGRGASLGLDCAYYVLSGSIIERADAASVDGDVRHPTGSLLNASCFLQGHQPTSTLAAEDGTELASSNVLATRDGSFFAADAAAAGGGSFNRGDGSGGSFNRGSSFRTGVASGSFRKARFRPSREISETVLGSGGGIVGMDGQGFGGARAAHRDSKMAGSFRGGDNPPKPPVVDECVVGCLEYAQVLTLARDEPHAARRFFAALAASLTGLLGRLSSDLRLAVRSVGSSAATDEALIVHFDRSVIQLARDFRLPTAFEKPAHSLHAGGDDAPPPEELVASSDCCVSLEVHSAYEWREVPARLYLFSNHLCIERAQLADRLPCLAERRTIPLADVLGLLDKRVNGGERRTSLTISESFKSEHKSHTSGRASTVAQSSRQNPASTEPVDEMKSGSVQMALPAARFDLLVREIEIARLAVSDTSNLTKSVDGVAGRNAGSGAWGVLRSSFNVAVGERVGLVDAARAAAAKSRRSWVSSGSGLTPRAEDIANHVVGSLPRRVSDSGAAVDAAALPNPTALPNPAARGAALLNETDWEALLAGASYRRYRARQKLIAAGTAPDGLYVVVNGMLRVDFPQADRPQALVVGRLEQGELFGERTLLLGSTPSVDIVCDSESALVMRLPRAHLTSLFVAQPALAAKFFCLIAARTSGKIRALIEQDLSSVELVMTDETAAPTTIAAIAENPAFLLILHKFVLSLDAVDAHLGPSLDFIQDVRKLLNEPDLPRLRQLVVHLHQLHLASNAKEPLPYISERMRGSVGELLAGMQAGVVDGCDEPHIWRHVFDVAVVVAMKAVEDTCFKRFLQSRHYQYVLSLKSKELVIPTAEHFRISKMLGQGGFGSVALVVKRDCGVLYAMKVQTKQQLEATFGDDWETLALTERRLLASLRHPLLVNLAYAFQTTDQLTLVMDACTNGDLSRFGAVTTKMQAPATLDKAQLRFVAIEVACLLLYLQSHGVLYRDLKPENLLLDGAGHVRLIDFGVSKQSSTGKNLALEVCGTPGYLAPEVHWCYETRRKYSYECDWFSYGVVLYELCENALPFGSAPEFEDPVDEWREPECLEDDDGREVAHLKELLLELLEWEPRERLCGDSLHEHPYYKNVDWELADRGRLPSPMVRLLENPDDDAGKQQQQQPQQPVAATAAMAGDAEIEAAPRGSERFRRRGQRVSRAVSIDDDALSLELSKAMATSQKIANMAQAADAASIYISEVAERAAENWREMHVEGWDYVSEHALANEYVVSAADVISIV